MNKWYRKTGVKAIVLIVAILSGAMLITNLLSLINLAGSTDLPSLWTMSQQPFEESQEFNYMVENYMDDVLTQIRLENLFETALFLCYLKVVFKNFFHKLKSLSKATRLQTRIAILEVLALC